MIMTIDLALRAHQNTVSPLNTIQRGYSILINEQGEVIRKARSVKRGQKIKAKLAEGQIIARVEEIETKQTELNQLIQSK